MMVGPSLTGYRELGGRTQKVTTRSVLNPCRRRCIRATLSSSSPAAASSNTASATSTTTNHLRTRCGVPPPRSFSFNACMSGAREVYSAGARPHSTLVTIDIADGVLY